MLPLVTAIRGFERPDLDDRSLPPNAISRGFSILGDEWTLFLLRFALLGRTRYADFSAEMPISHAVLSGRLNNLVTEGLMARREYQQRPPRSEYVLTDAGRSTWPILVAIWSWERRWVAQHSYETPPLRHTVCGEEITAVLTCAACDQPASATDLTTEWGPSGGWRRSVPGATTRRRSSTRGTSVAHSFYPDTMAIVGNRWSSAVVGAAMLGVRRFSDFEAVLGTPPSLLSGRLSQLCARGILRQTSTSARPDHLEYRLTDKGLDFYPVTATTIAWAERWFGAEEGPSLLSTHTACGRPFEPRLSCSHCHRQLAASELDLSES